MRSVISKYAVVMGLAMSLALAGLPAVAQESENEEETIVLESETEKLSYALGRTMAMQLKNDMPELDIEAFAQAVEDVFGGGELALDEAEMNQILQTWAANMQERRTQQQSQQASGNKEDGEAFLESNADKEGVVELDSGLQYQMLEEGDGPSPDAEDVVRVHYRGTLLDGTEFDSSYSRGEPAEFPLNRVIQGWNQGLQQMKVGGKAKLFIPSDLAYGDQARPSIPAGSTLIFEVELLDIVEDAQ